MMKSPYGLLAALLMLLGLPGFARAETDPVTQPPSGPTGEAGTGQAAPFKPTWDQAANIREAAQRLGNLQRSRGAKGTYDFIAACYKTQGLAENYSAPFEACIAQDYMQTQVLAQIYSRMTPEQLKNLGAPSAPALADAMGHRIVAAFSQYKIPVSYAGDFKKLVDQHGFPIFLALVFPNSKVPTTPVPDDKAGVPHQDNKSTDKP